jgi:dihydrofolate synthase / folylpolyglutamate synthase
MQAQREEAFPLNHEEAMNFIMATESSGSTLGLGVIGCLLEELGSPHRGMKYVHVAGTNGKGSTSAFISSILIAAGYKTGLFTSPFLLRFNEYIRVNGTEISDDEIDELTAEMAKASERVIKRGMRRPSSFEFTTALAFMYFRKLSCDIVVLEVGMGGRLDATNVIENAEVSVITNIGLDHMEFLGDTLELIAAEKAGIIKQGGRVVLYSQEPSVEKVIADICTQRKSSLTIAGGAGAKINSTSLDGIDFDYDKYLNLKIPLLGLYQVRNAVAALASVDELIWRGFKISENDIRNGLLSVCWPGRLELLNKTPVVIVDGAHNPQGTAALAETLSTLFPGQKISFIFGVLADKDYTGSIKTVLPLAKCFFTVTPPNSRALKAEDLASEIKKLGGVPAIAFADIPSAISAALKATPADEVICIFGSLYQVGEIITYFRRKY